MVQAAEWEPRCRKDNCGSGRCTTRILMSQMEEDAAPDVRGGLAAVSVALAIARVSSAAGTMYEDPADAAVLVRAASKVVAAITNVEADPSSVDRGVGHRLGDLLSS